MDRFGWKMWALVGTHHSLNFLWSPAFFYLKSPLLALLVVIALLGSITWLMLIQAHYSRKAFYLFVPYFLWVCFALVLNASIWYLNR